ncbi:polysaccharide deacetylase family protein [Allostreptomyces psammosilenae]|uniref:Peptidoglycan/xylan/chitin deacetylase (PgdA/CDA1 family) n=1 Tax=Allostreptomyces psammosilenae TaxID=1892865 RepID=A0A852ZZ93_9ACTN|nr:polysaccharide deacetylase family protein [Allostreptomyces psammosilenae]NYI07469.1 peptidoglycan/xylan/chitin deacetylase (PgdA/CDA1 family) [Allostreptomyces psammosilenae]
MQPVTFSGRRRQIDAVLRRSPAQALFRARAAHRLAVLAYHEIHDSRRFGAQLDRLLRVANPVSLEEVTEAVVAQRPLPPHSVLITLDDGDRSVLDRALPALAARGIPAVAFVIPGLLGGDTPFWWNDVAHSLAHGGTARGVTETDPHRVLGLLKTLPDADRRRIVEELRVTSDAPPLRQRQLTAEDLATLQAGGVAIGNHTLSHPCLDACDAETVRREIVEADRLLERALGRPVRTFAYPNGNFDERAERVLRQLGYHTAFLFDHRLVPARIPDPLRISRLRVGLAMTDDRFDTVVSGLHPAVHRLRGGT